MATLSITYAELRRYIGRFLGYSRSTTAIDADSDWDTDVEDILRSGMREFYFYRAAEGIEPGHTWSFLIKKTTISVSSGDTSISLPSDFSKMEDGFTFSAGSEQMTMKSDPCTPTGTHPVLRSIIRYELTEHPT